MSEQGHAPLYLSRLVLNPRNGTVQRDLANCQSLHRHMLDAMPGDHVGRAAHGLLFRVEPDNRGQGRIMLAQSAVAPDWSVLPTGYLLSHGAREDAIAFRRIDASYMALIDGQRLRFRLRANPTRKIDTKTRPDGTRSNGQRVPLRGAAALAWLERKGIQHGFRLRTATERPDPILGSRQIGWKADRHLAFEGTVFDGLIDITDASAFRLALQRGIGPGKAYGFGLLSVARG